MSVKRMTSVSGLVAFDGEINDSVKLKKENSMI